MKLQEKIAAGGVYFIAEMSANHGGSLDRAMEIVRAAAGAGADCLKVQTYTADTITLDCHNEYFRNEGGMWDGTNLHDLYAQAYTPWEWQPAIKAECERLGMDFLSSPFDETAVDFLESIGCGAYKIASFELNHIPLIDYAARTGKPVIMSTGIASLEDIQLAVDTVRKAGAPAYLLKCSSIYPADFSQLNYACIPDLHRRFGVPVGASDHSLGTLAAVVAALKGACIIEKHLCLSRSIPTADCKFSLEPQEFARMIRDVNDALAAVGTADYRLPEAEKRQLLGRRSIFVAADIRKGETFTRQNIRVVRPGHGLAPVYYPQVLGKTAARDLTFGQPLRKEDICE